MMGSGGNKSNVSWRKKKENEKDKKINGHSDKSSRWRKGERKVIMNEEKDDFVVWTQRMMARGEASVRL